MRSQRIVFALTLLGLAVSPIPAGVASVAAAPVATTNLGVSPASVPKPVPHNLADPNVDTPDPSIISDGTRFFAVSTGKQQRDCSSGVVGPMRVPHRSTTSLGNWPLSPCFEDVMHNGVGAWAAGTTYLETWAPSIARNSATGTYLLFYTAKKTGTEQRCIGRATAAGLTGEYIPDPTPLICGNGTLWALDANAFTENGRLFIQWRQDTATSSRLWGAEYSDDGRTRLTEARLLMESSDMTWDGPVPGGAFIIENPSIVHWGATNQYYLAFSGDYWASNDYATGMASCGPSLTSVAAGKCVLQAPSTKPFYGWSLRGHGGTLKTVPGNLPGPGGMSFVTRALGGFPGAGDHAYVALHYNKQPAGGVRPMAVFETFAVHTSPYLTNF